ncbi:MAG: DEAD/DEAH box helicase [Planctomycetota bacterium]
MELNFSQGTLTLTNAPRGFVERSPTLARYFTWDTRSLDYRSDALQYAAIQTQFAQFLAPGTSLPIEATTGGSGSPVSFEDQVPQWQPVSWPQLALRELRAEQEAAVAAWLPGRRGVIVMPTGTGKTEVALALMTRCATSTVVVSPVRDLMYQWQRRILAATGYDAGVIGDRLYQVKPISVTTYDSAGIHMERLGNQFGLIIFDECHHLPGPMRRDAARMSAAPWRLGLTATPDRADGRHADLDVLIGPKVYELTLQQVRGQSVADYDVVRVPVHLTSEEQARYNRLSREVQEYMLARRQEEPEFSWEDLCADLGRTPEARRAHKAYLAKQAIEDRALEKLRVIEDLFRLHPGEKCLIFAGSNAMARDVSRRFLIPCLLSHCVKEERREVMTGIEPGPSPARVANKGLDAGVDLPAVQLAIVIGGTSSSRQAKQRLGRILRKSGRTRALLYEIVCQDTNEEDRSRKRRSSEAYQGTRHRRAPEC